MGYFQVRYDSRVVNYDRRGFIRLATDHSSYPPPNPPGVRTWEGLNWAKEIKEGQLKVATLVFSFQKFVPSLGTFAQNAISCRISSGSLVFFYSNCCFQHIQTVSCANDHDQGHDVLFLLKLWSNYFWTTVSLIEKEHDTQPKWTNRQFRK